MVVLMLVRVLMRLVLVQVQETFEMFGSGFLVGKTIVVRRGSVRSSGRYIKITMMFVSGHEVLVFQP